MMPSLMILRRLVTLSIIVSLIVVMLGAYTRLTQAGLGCPDWPGCYGRMAVFSLQHNMTDAQAVFPDSPIETKKAWTEMVHRYAAGVLVLLIALINGGAFIANRQAQRGLWILPLILVGLIIFQAALGMWTVTLKLLPLVVMGHLLGGILIFSSLCYLRVQLSPVRPVDNALCRYGVTLALVLVFCQIALGGWVSSNYAGIACIGFPQCNGQWLPVFQWSKAFHLFSPVGANYQGGVLDSGARMTIQTVHRMGAFVVASYLLMLSAWLWTHTRFGPLRLAVIVLVCLLVTQFTLGIVNVVYLLPLWAAIFHNAVAALLLALCFVMRYLVSGEARHAKLL
jgi:cytochrome c oxidase assembly protein subunit 15